MVIFFQMETVELKDFYNAGFGWICKSCEREIKAPGENADLHSRLLREGESESKKPTFSNAALAKWADADQKILVCPRCGKTERIPK